MAPGAGADHTLGRTGSAVTRVLQVLVHNWPLKLAAIGLATLLYGGLVFVAEHADRSRGRSRSKSADSRDDAVLLTDVEPVTTVRYLVAVGRPPDHVDVRGLDRRQRRRARQRSAERAGDRGVDRRSHHGPRRRARSHDGQPRQARDAHRPGARRPGRPARRPRARARRRSTRREVEISGPASVVDRVVEARANVQIQPTGIDVDQDVRLVPVDAARRRRRPGQRRARDGARDDPGVLRPRLEDRSRSARSITGDPAPGFEVAAATVVATGRHGRGRRRRARAARQHRYRAGLDQRAVVERDIRDNPGAADRRRRPRRRDRPRHDHAPPGDRDSHVRGRTGPRRRAPGPDATARRRIACSSRWVARWPTWTGSRARRSSRPSTSRVSSWARPRSPVATDLPAGIALVSASPDRVAVTVSIPPPPSPATGGSSPSASPAAGG